MRPRFRIKAQAWLRSEPALLRSSRHHAQKKTAHASEQSRPDVAEQREAWFEAQLDLDPDLLIFIDETCASTNMPAFTVGLCSGQRLRVGVLHGHWKTTTFIEASTLRGFIAPFVIDGAVYRLAFVDLRRQGPCPELRQRDVVIMDNLPCHKASKVRQLIEAVGAILISISRYSPYFNPIDNAFAKLNALLRKAAERTLKGLWCAIVQLIDLITPQEIQNLFAAAGYDAA